MAHVSQEQKKHIADKCRVVAKMTFKQTTSVDHISGISTSGNGTNLTF